MSKAKIRKKYLMFHEIVWSQNDHSGWNVKTQGKYSITPNEFHEIISFYGPHVEYTFDDGGESMKYVIDVLDKYKIRGTFCIPTYYIDKEGFLEKSFIASNAQNHNFIPHGHRHLMNTYDEDLLRADWKKSIEIIEEITGQKRCQVCLPGGSISKAHIKVLKNLGIEEVYHSAPTNLMVDLFSNDLKFIPRLVIQKNVLNSNRIRLENSVKSVIRQFRDLFLRR